MLCLQNHVHMSYSIYQLGLGTFQANDKSHVAGDHYCGSTAGRGAWINLAFKHTLSPVPRTAIFSFHFFFQSTHMGEMSYPHSLKFTLEVNV